MNGNGTLQRQRIMSSLSKPGSRFQSGASRPAVASQSLPDVRGLFNPSSLSASTTSFPGKLRPAGSSQSALTISTIRDGNMAKNRFSLPPIRKGTSSLQNSPNMNNYEEMIAGALRAGEFHYPRGMKGTEILEVVYSVYTNILKSQGSDASLKRTLENLVAKGAVSRSFGATARDATYRLVNAAAPVSNFEPELGLNLTVTGKGIKPISPMVHVNRSLGLPSANNFQTRVARTYQPKRDPTTPKEIPKPRSVIMSQRKPKASLASMEKCKLSKSFAFRVGAIDTLKPLEFIPNSPVSRADENRSWTPYSPKNGDLDPESEDEQDNSLVDRFRAYAEAINLKPDDENPVYKIAPKVVSRDQGVETERNEREDTLNAPYEYETETYLSESNKRVEYSESQSFNEDEYEFYN